MQSSPAKFAHILHEVVRAAPTWTDDMPVFMSPQWLASQSQEFGWLTTESNSGAQMILPFVLCRKGPLRWLQFHWSVWSNEPTDVETEHDFLEAVVEWCRREKLDLIAQPTTACVFRAAPNGAVSAPFGTFMVDLEPEEGALWARTKHRNMIRRGTAEGVTIEWGEHLVDEAYELCAESMSRSNVRFMTVERFRKICGSLGSLVDIGVAWHDGAPNACVVVPTSGFCAHGLYAGTAGTHVHGASNLLNWEAILRAKSRGAKYFDFVGVRLNPAPGSKYEGIRRFKEYFGGDLVEGCLWKMPLSRTGYQLHKALKRARGDGLDTIDQVLSGS